MNLPVGNKTLSWVVLAIVSAVASVSFAASASADKTSFEQVQKKMGEAAAAIKNYSVEQRDEAGRQVEDTLHELDADIKDMQQRLYEQADHMDKASRQQARDALEAIRQQRNDLSEWYGRMQHSTGNAWMEIKSGFVKSFEELQKSYDDAKNEF
ncbi:MAG TPA: hypothetical protein VIQ81_02185 [Gammaproteobacteria bacterium]